MKVIEIISLKMVCIITCMFAYTGILSAQIVTTDKIIPGGEYDMGDHFGFVDPSHPSDETPVHKVKVDSFYMSNTETSNQQFLDFLNAALKSGSITVLSNIVYLSGNPNIICYTNQYEPWYSISFNGNVFSMSDFRASHPVVGVMWFGAISYCNWLSSQKGLQACYNLNTLDCDFTKNGYRLPTEAEWEWAARGGHKNPYLQYEKGDTAVIAQANLPDSGDPYESTSTALYPLTTPVGFYDGTLKLKSTYAWPGAALSYQTKDGANDFGLYDMQGNVWELINDWYTNNYYATSPYNNPTGPLVGFTMPDGKAYRGMRGGNWYNGNIVNGINDGHSRVSNRNPSYFRGPLDPNHPWYHVGFRVARKVSVITDVKENTDLDVFQCYNYPNPFQNCTTIQLDLSKVQKVKINIYNAFGELLLNLVDQELKAGTHRFNWCNENSNSGIYFYSVQSNKQILIHKMIVIQ